MKKILSVVLLLALCLSLLPLSASAATVLARVELSLECPVAGKTPAATCSINGNGYTVHSIDWYDRTDDRFLDAGEKFQAGHQYEAQVWVEAKDGYKFSTVDDNTPAIGGYINGEEVEVEKAFEYKAYAMVCLVCSFPSAPAKGWIKSVDLTVPVPVAGEEPDYTQLTGTGYRSGTVSFGGSPNPNIKNGICWYGPEGLLEPGHHSFEENTIYTFRCQLLPDEENYRFTPDAKVTVNGKEAKVSYDYDLFLAVTYDFPATGAQHTHTPSEWRTTGAYHYKACTTCGDFLEQEDHFGGAPTCTEKAKCEVCGEPYGQDEPSHKWSPTYLYQDENGHAWICADCKEISEIFPHEAGPTGTPGADVVCKDCGYIITPAKDHVHSLEKHPKVPATCMEAGQIEYYTCDGCSGVFKDEQGSDAILTSDELIIGALGHTPGENWEKDSTCHWRICTVCKEALAETKMLHEIKEGVCSTCGYGRQDLPAPQPEGSAVPAVFGWIAGLGLGGLALGIAVIAIVLCLIAGAVALILVIRKKRK